MPEPSQTISVQSPNGRVVSTSHIYAPHHGPTSAPAGGLYGQWGGQGQPMSPYGQSYGDVVGNEVYPPIPANMAQPTYDHAITSSATSAHGYQPYDPAFWPASASSTATWQPVTSSVSPMASSPVGTVPADPTMAHSQNTRGPYQSSTPQTAWVRWDRRPENQEQIRASLQMMMTGARPRTAEEAAEMLYGSLLTCDTLRDEAEDESLRYF
ncbi:hypothetical protein WOLCODRAFT_137964 [Wolfiporia cocos MD-104 SS10]|uniref:Uncharacterized protein n=1 Tax=Wolfiporia cocos (strain MD-104) TaxID=742152 RepID=A0A2H3JRM8_WOLCO|nr:hypothetical protein WOLCODRAFT_137964 [Wolfiporia cocos MD-104 SS10]